MTEPSQYFKGRTVQEQMDEVIGYVDTRAAEVATTAIASDVAQVHQDMLDADADAQAAAASAAAAAGTLANAVKKTGEASQSIAGDIAVAGDLSAGGDLGVTGDAGVQGQLSVLGGCDLRAPVKIPVAPTNNDDAASKKYVDDADALKLTITDINQYAVTLVDNQDITGIKRNIGANLTGVFVAKASNIEMNVTPPTTVVGPSIGFVDKNNAPLGGLYIQKNANGKYSILLRILQSDNTTWKYITLGSSD